MVIYTDLTKKEIANYGELFNLGPIKNFHLLKGGSSNSNFLLITDKGKYVLTICEDKTFEQVRPLIALLQHLEAHNFHTSKMLKSHCGEFLLKTDNKPVYLKSYIEGLVPRILSLASLENLGRMIAKLHKIQIFDSIPAAYSYWSTYFTEAITSSSSHPYMDWLNQKSHFFEEHLPNDLPRGLVHGDIFTDNLVEGTHGQITIIDFEAVSHSPFIFDIGMALIGVCSEKNFISLRKAKALIKGYQQERKFNQKEKNNIKLFAIYAATVTSVWRFRLFHLKIPTQKRFNRYQQMVDIADSLVQMKNSVFMKQVGLS
ncbi:MAG: homoserine kinase [Candidatus Hodarchaeales archaeon]|jgi:homoserine kinase type II